MLIQLQHSLHEALAGGLDTAALFERQSQFVRRASYMSFDIALGKPAGELLDRLDRRQDAFEICAQLVDEVKKLLPMWKLQRFADGTDEWVNCS